jgi:hypothetical protein
MPKVFPWHSVKETHYHNNTTCMAGRKIPVKERVSGTGSKPLCLECYRLNSNGK